MKIKISRKACINVVVILGFLLSGILFLSFLSNWEVEQTIVDVKESAAPDDGRMSLDGIWYVPNDSLNAVLIIGVDKYEGQLYEESYNNNMQADFLMLFLADSQTETYTVLHLNRDTMTDVPVLGVRGEKAGMITGQLALAHTYGSGGHDSCRNTVEAVSNLLYGAEINHYIAFTMDAVPVVNDLAGGVTLKVQEDLTAISPELEKESTVTLTGDLALAYVRTRYGLEDSSNLKRMERQRQYLFALQKTLSEKFVSDDTFLMDILDKISPYMDSDCTVNQLSQMYEQWELYTNGGVLTIEGETVAGEKFMEFYPNEENLKKLVVELFYVPLNE